MFWHNSGFFPTVYGARKKDETEYEKKKLVMKLKKQSVIRNIQSI
jgi:hypothetical protein